MAHPPYYSPRIDRGLVTRLYFAAKARNVPLTVLTNRLVTDGLERMQEVPSPDRPIRYHPTGRRVAAPSTIPEHETRLRNEPGFLCPDHINNQRKESNGSKIDRKLRKTAGPAGRASTSWRCRCSGAACGRSTGCRPVA
jgi:hypothetical protein